MRNTIVFHNLTLPGVQVADMTAGNAVYAKETLPGYPHKVQGNGKDGRMLLPLLAFRAKRTEVVTTVGLPVGPEAKEYGTVLIRG